MAYQFRKRRRSTAWLWIIAFLCFFYGVVALIPRPVPRSASTCDAAPALPAGKRAACLLPRARPPLSERDQARLAACRFGMGNDLAAFVADEFVHAAAADPHLGSRTVWMVAVSPQGEVRDVGETLLEPGKEYRHALIGREAERLFVEVVIRGDGTRGYGLGPYLNPCRK